jgi:hypothetical protein
VIVALASCGCFKMAVSLKAPSTDLKEFIDDAEGADLTLESVTLEQFRKWPYACEVCEPKPAPVVIVPPSEVGYSEPWYSPTALERAGQMSLWGAS